ncbi:MAG: terminase family protein [Bacteroidia bacterium]|nr:terminase family protein [Bacteroidia bacterium]
MSSSVSPQQKQNKVISKEKAIEALWYKGNLSYKLHDAQKDMYKFVREHHEQILVIGASRRLGKSYFLLTLAFEECLRKPNAIVKYVAQTTKDVVNNIAKQLIHEITKDCPKKLLPKYHVHNAVLTFPNGSEIHFSGTEQGRAEKLRGSNADLCIVDEAGFCFDLDYIVTSVLFPLTTLTKGKIILASTPSKSADHAFIRMMYEAEAEGRFLKKTIYDNPMLTQDDINRIAEELGGKDSVVFRREFLVEPITSEQDAVIPEFDELIELDTVKEYNKPPYYVGYVAMDIGGKDLTAILFGYYDFANARIIIEDELAFKAGTLSDDIAKYIKEKEEKLFKDAVKVLRYSDNNNIIFINDLAIKHQLYFNVTAKDDKEAALNDVRMRIKSRKIIINPRCKNLIAHLKNAIWAKNKKDFARSAQFGHYDFIDALIYLVRNINYSFNPYPDSYSSFSVSEDQKSLIVNNPTPSNNNIDFANYMANRIRSISPFLRKTRSR